MAVSFGKNGHSVSTSYTRVAAKSSNRSNGDTNGPVPQTHPHFFAFQPAEKRRYGEVRIDQ